MLLEQKTSADGTLIGIWKIEETEEELLLLFDGKETVLHQIEPVSNPVKRCEKLAVRALLKTLTGYEKRIIYMPSGKPALSDRSFNISISHTKGYAAIALNKHKIVGLDIEAISNRACRINHRFMSIKEREALDKSNEAVVSLLNWSAKETVYKLMSKEGVDFQKEIFIAPFAIDDNQLLATESHTDANKQFIIYFEVTARYVLTSGVAR
jgi:4'-phosphopantetheinyl transferase